MTRRSLAILTSLSLGLLACTNVTRATTSDTDVSVPVAPGSPTSIPTSTPITTTKTTSNPATRPTTPWRRMAEVGSVVNPADRRKGAGAPRERVAAVQTKPSTPCRRCPPVVSPSPPRRELRRELRPPPPPLLVRRERRSSRNRIGRCVPAASTTTPSSAGTSITSPGTANSALQNGRSIQPDESPSASRVPTVFPSRVLRLP